MSTVSTVRTVRTVRPSAGELEVGTDGKGEVILNLDRDRNGVGHLVFSPEQAYGLAKILNKMARRAVAEIGRRSRQEVRTDGTNAGTL